MAYSFDFVDLARHGVHQIDSILKDAKPGEIPIYQSSKVALSINLKTAKTLGTRISPSLLARADEVIE
jgi:putative ABC transport system substrate-binding protein